MARIPGIPSHAQPGLWGSIKVSRMKRNTGRTRKEFIDEIAKRDIKHTCKDYTFIYTFGNEWRIIPSKLFTNNFEGSIDEALDSDKVSDEFKDFLIFNLELFR